jgi:hypothetical protein
MYKRDVIVPSKYIRREKMNKRIKTFQYLDLGEHESIEMIAKPNSIEVVWEYPNEISTTTTDWTNIVSRNNESEMFMDSAYFHEDGYITIKRFGGTRDTYSIRQKPTQYTIYSIVHKDDILHFEDEDGNRIDFDWKVFAQVKNTTRVASYTEKKVA